MKNGKVEDTFQVEAAAVSLRLPSYERERSGNYQQTKRGNTKEFDTAI